MSYNRRELAGISRPKDVHPGGCMISSSLFRNAHVDLKMIQGNKSVIVLKRYYTRKGNLERPHNCWKL